MRSVEHYIKIPFTVENIIINMENIVNLNLNPGVKTVYSSQMNDTRNSII